MIFLPFPITLEKKNYVYAIRRERYFLFSSQHIHLQYIKLKKFCSSFQVFNLFFFKYPPDCPSLLAFTQSSASYGLQLEIRR